MTPTPRFLTFLPFIFKWEGTSYENDPDDPGGETKFGIDKRSHPSEDIKHLTAERAAEIYFSFYWLKVHADEMPEGVGEVMMDIGVNNGIGRAIKWAQQEVGVTADGVLGPISLSAIIQRGPILARALLQRRHDFYQDIAVGHMHKYLIGWLNRNNDLIALVA